MPIHTLKNDSTHVYLPIKPESNKSPNEDSSSLIYFSLELSTMIAASFNKSNNRKSKTGRRSATNIPLEKMEAEKTSSEKGGFLSQIIKYWRFERPECDQLANGGSCLVFKCVEIVSRCHLYTSLGGTM